MSIALTAAASVYAAPREEKNTSHYNGTDPYAIERCKLDVSVPDNATDTPLVVWFHGGGLTGGGKEIPKRLRDAGYVVVAPNYRLIPRVPVDSCINDAARAVAWAFDNAVRLGTRLANIRRRTFCRRLSHRHDWTRKEVARKIWRRCRLYRRTRTL